MDPFTMQPMGGAGDDQFFQYLSQMPEEELLAMFQPFDQQQALLQQQLGQNQAFMKPQDRQRTTGAGAALSGLSDAIRGGVGAYRQDQFNAQMGELLKGQQTEAGKRAKGYADALMKGRQGGPARTVEVPVPAEFIAAR